MVSKSVVSQIIKTISKMEYIDESDVMRLNSFAVAFGIEEANDEKSFYKVKGLLLKRLMSE